LPNDNKENKNPYFDGRKEWNIRYGSLIKQVKTWKTITFISLFTTLASVAGLTYIGSQNKLVPYIVEVDKVGAVKAINYAQQSNIDNKRVIKYSLAEFIQNFKTIYRDAKIQKDMIFKIYRYLSPSYPAYNMVNSYYKEHSPFERLTKETVRVKVNSIVQINTNTYQVDWEEIVSDPRGVKLRTDSFKASITILMVPPATQSEIMKNPIGLYIKEFNFSKIIK
jgi:type IV secretion system protein VirB5